MSNPTRRRGATRGPVWLLCAWIAVALGGGGCVIAPLLRSAELKGEHKVKPEYTGLAGKTFAVVVAADRMIQAEFPLLVDQVTTTVAYRLRDHAGASGWVPPESVLRFQGDTPRWSAMSLAELAEELGVDRVVFIEVREFRLREPGNEYLWAAVAGGSVAVYEADSPLGGGIEFERNISVSFPTKQQALGPEQISGETVMLELAKRFVNRASWLFYEHKEANVIDY